MPRRKRRGKAKVDAWEVASMFLYDDGVRGSLDGDPVYQNVFLARAGWETFRARTWDMWEERGQCRPPTGAVAYDGLTEELHEIGHGASPHEALEAARADLAAIDRFRSEHAKTAELIEPQLTTLNDLLLTAEAALVALGDAAAIPYEVRSVWLQRRHFAAQGRP